ncbi:hypothetical protein [Ideonella sp. B508-1]|uniref:hypothetical protein n=1 Tax=Ideonella sp. B508-1 TaxID=137716 RepID=UPI0011D211EF|nr:hypothetical protein [Ideonella sp. B508-1]
MSLTFHIAGELPAVPRMGWFAQMGRALRRMAQWRLLLAWWAVLTLPAIVVGLPVWQALSRQLDHSLLAPTLARSLDPALLAEALGQVFMAPSVVPVPVLGAMGLVWTLLFTPWLTAMAGVAARQPQVLRWHDLLRAGLADYGRMGRALVWGGVLLILAMAVGNGLTHLAERRSEHMVLQSDALFWERLGQGLTWFLALLALASAEAGRAVLVLEPRRRSAVLAWWRGLRMLLADRGRALGLFLGLSLLAALGLALCTGLRWCLDSLPSGGLALAWLLGQLGLLLLVWGRCARLCAVVDAGRMAGRAA